MFYYCNLWKAHVNNLLIKQILFFFTDNINNGWIIDTTPYHLINKSELDNDTFTNSIYNNKRDEEYIKKPSRKSRKKMKKYKE